MKNKKCGKGKFFLGALVGAGAALLLAPQSGSETRKQLKLKLSELLNKVKEIDELGRTTTYQYDSLNRRIKEIDANGNETKYEYDNANNITKVTDANGNSTEMKFDSINNVMLEEKDANNKRCCFSGNYFCA